MKICFTLDDVLRAKTKQIAKMIKKHINADFDAETLDFTDKEYWEAFGFETKKIFEEFLYKDYFYEVFGEADPAVKMCDKNMNLWLLDIDNNDDIEEPVEVLLSNPREFNASIGCTCFFLSKIATRVRNIFFPKDSLNIWDNCDILITADRNLLENKPNDKVSIKINTDYNQDVEADIVYDDVNKLFADSEFFNKINDIKTNN